MAQVSKRRVKPEITSKIFSLLFDVIGSQSDTSKFKILIDGILSPTEKIMIAKRIAIFFLLTKQIDWKSICDILKVSNASVSKCRMILINNTEMNVVLNGLIKKKQTALFFEEIFLLFFGPGTAYVNWKSAFERKIKLEERKSEVL